LGDFSGFHGKVFLMVDFRFFLIEWVLGIKHLAKGSPQGSPTIPKSSLWSVEWIGRSIAWSFEFFPRAVFLLTVQAKTAWLVSQTGLTNLALWAVEKGFLARESLSCYGFFCSKVERLLRCFGSQGSLGSVWTKPAWPVCQTVLTGFPYLCEAKSSRSGLTGFRNRPDRF
jgi:hypothetical protein